MNVSTFEISSPLSVKYWSLLKNLSDMVKLELAAMLVNSVAHKESKKENWTDQFAGKWKDSRSAEEIIDYIYQTRTENREIEL